jgi:CO/xanthine dehydrogenase FAD-binding subunit
MRSNAEHYQVVGPKSLDAALALLAAEPGLTPIAGGTELMVALGAGRLATRSLVSIQHLRELRFIQVESEAITLGAGTTFSEIRRHKAIGEDLPLLVEAASWTGSIANQNRGTIGGNIVNASPAADSPPALLVYEASVNLVSARGARTIPYREFHLGYKKTALEPGELVYSVSIPRCYGDWRGYIRKVGTRNAQAISKIAIAGLALVRDGIVDEIRVGAASLREVPWRCAGVEAVVKGQRITAGVIQAARSALLVEAKPIDDIRSTARYRAAVAANLVQEFLESIGPANTSGL